ncbi:DNA-binding domain-containing protein [Enterovibrio sp. ZSDZ35]|uniref:DNA-binding domain-containing protein n=1 Tax=Enterovibrio qingdaonensis TaxID=2899818 RepID=A0ABT5QRD8_9GAMM|nr:DNA-binding domain-containing protein [Enterovibrio sp. ZSDZ35]MDD1783545.1 DNA-binding domain-containing protein [Enterovibrio sp. ZSDZ35]
MSAPDLAKLQRQFSEALHYQGYSLPVAEGLADVDALIQVYRNNFVMTLSECLETAYPTVHALVGCECFEALARHHVLATPMTSACADQYGEGFDRTISAIPNIIDAVPYLADVATLEWRLQQVNHAPLTVSVFPLLALQQLRPDQFEHVRLSVSASVSVMTSAYPVSAIWQAISHRDDDALAAIDMTQCEGILLQKTEEGIEIHPIEQGEAKLIEACRDYEMGLIDPPLLSHLAAVMQRGVFTDFTLVHHQ